MRDSTNQDPSLVPKKREGALDEGMGMAGGGVCGVSGGDVGDVSGEVGGEGGEEGETRVG